MKETKYTVEWKMYQYNSGRADNGTFTACQSFDNLEDAKDFKNNIRKAQASGEEEINEWVEELIEDWTVCGGYIKNDEPVLKKIESETTIIE